MRSLRLACVLLLSFLTISAAPAAAAPAPAPPPAAAEHRLDIKEIRLDNGLRIFVLENTASPTFAGYYQFNAAAAFDPKGRSGIAHLLEHMMFKGTETLGTTDYARERPLLERLSVLWHQLDAEIDRADDPFGAPARDRIEALKKEIETVSAAAKELLVKNEYDELMTRAGGVGENATTGEDVTNYFIQLPANRLELWFKLESDRLLHPVFREFWSERDVVHEERRMGDENQAEGLASEMLNRLLFSVHPYGTPIVGWSKDIGRLKEEDALAAFTSHYSPANCVMVLAGDVKAAEVERLARQYLGAWKPQEMRAPDVTAEPEQRGERRAVIEFDAEPNLFQGWITVPEGHPDGSAATILGMILGGLSSSRLDKSLVQEQQLASSVWAYQNSMRWAGAMGVGATPQGGHTTAELETAIAGEVRRIQDEGVTADELERAKIQWEAYWVRNLKSNLGQAMRIGDAVGVSGTLDYLYEFQRRIEAVTAADVQAVARKYLVPAHLCVVEVRKTPGASGAASGDTEDTEHAAGEAEARGQKHSTGFAEAMAMIRSAPPLQLKVPQVGKDVDRILLPCGATVYIREDHSAPSVDMRFTWLGGSNTTPVEALAPFELADQLLTEGGTQALDPIALQDRIEQLGMRFSISTGPTGSGASFWSLKRNFAQAFSLAMDMLMKPRLDPERLDVIKGQYKEGMKRRYDYPEYAADLLNTYVVHGDHPRLGYQATRKEIDAVTPDDVRRIWQRYTGRDNLYITAVGDFDKREILDLLQQTFAGWRVAEDRKREWIVREPVARPGVYLVEKEVSAPAVALSAEIKVDRTAPLEDHAAVEILNDILGGSGFRSRLMERLRSDEGLTYGIYSTIWHNNRPGVPGGISSSYVTKKVSLARSIDIVMEEFRKMATGPVTPAEVEEQIDAWRNAFVFRFTDDFYTTSRLMQLELDDRSYDWDQQMLAAVQKVTPAEVERAARKYLKPGDLSICIFGTLTDEDRKALEAGYTLKVLPRAEVFRGGYDEEEPAKE